jgi:hypothetical protein
MAVFLKAADPIFSFSSAQTSPFFSGIKAPALWTVLIKGLVGWVPEMLDCQSIDEKADYYNPDFIVSSLKLRGCGWRWIGGRKVFLLFHGRGHGIRSKPLIF